MTLTFPCQHCHQLIEFDESLRNQAVECPSCGGKSFAFISKQTTEGETPRPVDSGSARKIALVCIALLLVGGLAAFAGVNLARVFAVGITGAALFLLLAAWVIGCVCIFVILVMWIVFPVMVYSLLKKIERNTRP